MLIEHAFTLFFANGLCTLQHAKAEKPYVVPQDTVWHWKVSGASTSQNHMAKLLSLNFWKCQSCKSSGSRVNGFTHLAES